MFADFRCLGREGRVDTAAVALFEGATFSAAQCQQLDAHCGSALKSLMSRREFSAAAGQLHCVYPSKGLERLYALGLGPKSEFDRGAPLRAASAALLHAADRAGVKRVELHLPPTLRDKIQPDLAGQAVGAGLAIGNFRFETFKGALAESDRAGRKRRPSLGVRIDPAMRSGLRRALRIGASANLARTLAATPPNVATPSYLVSFCRRMARQVGLRCTVVNAKQATNLNMNGLLAVGAAGSTPPALICLEHRPTSMRTSRPARGSAKGPVLLVGKAITFDTGGFSLKPPASMDAMKYDKCGGTAVIGAMHAIARLGLRHHVVALVPTAENLVDQKGYRPGDILRLYNGVTVEVTNTDAEGRLVLADALAYGCRRFKPRAIVDLATLTGGAVVALGSFCAALFCTNSNLQDHLIEAGQVTGERLWPLPLWNEHRAMLKSAHADIVNSKGREASPIQGAAFLSHFVDKRIPWAHIDIAGVSDLKEGNSLFTKGPTGFGVRMLLRAIERMG